MINVRIGEKIKSLRRNEAQRPGFKSLSRAKFCEEFNSREFDVPALLTRTLKSWEDGQNLPNLNYLGAFCEFFDVDMSYWFDDKRISPEKILEDISSYTSLNERAVKELSDPQIFTDNASLQARDSLITTGTLELLAGYAGKINTHCQRLRDYGKIIMKNEENIALEVSPEQYTMLFKLELFQMKECREKIFKAINDFLDSYTDYSKISESFEDVIERLGILETLQALQQAEQEPQEGN